MIRRRHVFYVEGYDPQGAVGYHRLFARELKRFAATWPVQAKAGDPIVDSDDLAHWTIEAAGPNWQVTTRYEFLRMEALIAANLAQPISRQVLRVLRWMVTDLTSGTLLRIFRASWRFGLHLIYPQIALALGLLLSLAAGPLAAHALASFAPMPPAVEFLLAVVAAVAVFAALLPLAKHWFVLRVTNGWPYLREFARGEPSSFDRPVEVLAERLVAVAQSNEAEEIILFSHSAGCVVSLAIMARALELDPDLGRHGPRVVYVTLGSLMPAFAMHPDAERMRAALRRIAQEPFALWIDCQSRKDVMNFWEFDPVAGVGIDVGPRRYNPLLWQVRFKEMVSPEYYQRLRWRFFRMHFQFIYASDRRAPYDYAMLVTGPAPIEAWARQPQRTLAAFSETAAFDEERAPSA